MRWPGAVVVYTRNKFTIMLISRAASGRKLVAGQLPAAPTPLLPLLHLPLENRRASAGFQLPPRGIRLPCPLALAPCKLDAITRIRNICTVQVKLDKAAS